MNKQKEDIQKLFYWTALMLPCAGILELFAEGEAIAKIAYAIIGVSAFNLFKLVLYDGAFDYKE